MHENACFRFRNLCWEEHGSDYSANWHLPIRSILMWSLVYAARRRAPLDDLVHHHRQGSMVARRHTLSFSARPYTHHNNRACSCFLVLLRDLDGLRDHDHPVYHPERAPGSSLRGNAHTRTKEVAKAHVREPPAPLSGFGSPSAGPGSSLPAPWTVA